MRALQHDTRQHDTRHAPGHAPSRAIARYAALMALTWALTLTACTGAAPPPADPRPPGQLEMAVITGFSGLEGRGQASGWWMTKANGVVAVTGQPSSTVVVSLSMAPSPCGPAQVSVANRTVRLTASVGVSFRVSVGRSGVERLPVFSFTPGCHRRGDPRALYAFVTQASVTQLRRSKPAQIVAADGFALPETGKRGPSWWLTARQGSLVASGPPSTPVTVKLTVSPPPCGGTEMVVAAKRYRLIAPIEVSVPITLGADGIATVPVSAVGPACRVRRDPRDLHVLVSRLSVAARS